MVESEYLVDDKCSNKDSLNMELQKDQSKI